MRYTLFSLVAILLGVSLLTHLWQLASPPEVVFDEVHFGKFVTAYCCTGERFFDIHPPHAKLLIAAVAKLGGYAGDFAFASIGDPYGDTPIGALRLFPAITGAVLPLVVFWLLRELGARPLIAFLGGWLVLFDTAFTVQTRIIALDGLLLVAQVVAIAAYLAAERIGSGSRHWSLVVVAGVAAGLAVGTKFTGLTAIGMLVILSGIRIGQAYWKRVDSTLYWHRGLVIALVAIAVYGTGWFFHFWLLPQPGDGDAFMVPRVATEGWSGATFLADTWQLHQVMFNANYGLEAGHPDASKWWWWPINGRSVFYWQGGAQAAIYFLGNPAVWWGVLGAFVVALVGEIVQFGQRRTSVVARNSVQLWIPLVAFLVAFLPLVRVPRALFLYHYLTPLLFSLVFALLWWQQRGWHPAERRDHAQWYIGILAVTAGFFVFFSPLVYGMAVSPLWQSLLFWFPSWQ